MKRATKDLTVSLRCMISSSISTRSTLSMNVFYICFVAVSILPYSAPTCCLFISDSLTVNLHSISTRRRRRRRRKLESRQRRRRRRLWIRRCSDWLAKVERSSTTGLCFIQKGKQIDSNLNFYAVQVPAKRKAKKTGDSAADEEAPAATMQAAPSRKSKLRLL